MTWVTKQEYRQSSVGIVGLTLNAAFLQEIKEDHIDFRDLLEDTVLAFSHRPLPPIREMSDRLGRLRDSLESYFALEEFYGYFGAPQIINQAVSAKANSLREHHATLFTLLNSIVDLCEQILYRESGTHHTPSDVSRQFLAFYHQLLEHEDQEIALLFQLNNEEIGGGD